MMAPIWGDITVPMGTEEPVDVTDENSSLVKSSVLSHRGETLGSEEDKESISPFTLLGN